MQDPHHCKTVHTEQCAKPDFCDQFTCLRRNALQAAFEISPIGAAFVDKNGNFILVNQSYASMLGYGKDELMKKSYQEITHADDLQKDNEQAKLVCEGKIDSYKMRKRYISKNGDSIWVDLYVYGVFNAEKRFEYFIAKAINVTELIKYQNNLQKSNDDLQRFAYLASHDLQEPLRMIFKYLQLIENRYKDRLDKEGCEFLQFATDGAKRMSDLISGLLDLSRIDSKGEKLIPIKHNHRRSIPNISD